MHIQFQAISEEGREFRLEKELNELQLRHARHPWIPMKLLLEQMFKEFSATLISFSDTYRTPEDIL